MVVILEQQDCFVEIESAGVNGTVIRLQKNAEKKFASELGREFS